MQRVSFLSTGGSPAGASAYHDFFETHAFAAIASVTTTGVIVPLAIVPPNDLFNLGGLPALNNPNTLDAPSEVAVLKGAWVTLITQFAATATLQMQLNLYRFTTLGAARTNAGGAYTSITLAQPLRRGMPSGQTLTLVDGGGNANTLTLSAAAAAGATVVTVNSFTPTADAAVGAPISFLVGNTWLAGWVAAGTGTPLFGARAPKLLPWNAANPAVIASTVGAAYYEAVSAGAGTSFSGVPLEPYDQLELLINTSTSTVSTLPQGYIRLGGN